MAKVFLVYDGGCPLCQAYAKHVRLKKALNQKIELVNAREGGVLVEALFEKGYDLDKGMVFQMDEQVFYGKDALYFMSMLSTSSDLFNRVMGALFRSPRLSAIVYPLLAWGRRGLLLLLGRGSIKKRP